MTTSIDFHGTLTIEFSRLTEEQAKASLRTRLLILEESLAGTTYRLNIKEGHPVAAIIAETRQHAPLTEGEPVYLKITRGPAVPDLRVYRNGTLLPNVLFVRLHHYLGQTLQAEIGEVLGLLPGHLSDPPIRITLCPVIGITVEPLTTETQETPCPPTNV